MDEDVTNLGYTHYYIENKQTKIKFIPSELRDKFLKEFGDNLISTNGKDVENFIERNTPYKTNFI